MLNGCAEMWNGITGLALKIEQHTQICLGLNAVRVNRSRRFQLRNRQVGPLLVQMLLCLLDVGRKAILLVSCRLTQTNSGKKEKDECGEKPKGCSHSVSN